MSGYTKLFGSILDSTVWELPHTTVRVWVTLMAMADRDGEVQASVPGLAHRARVTLEETENALEAFLSPDKYSRTPDQDGRRIEPIDGGWRLINHRKYTEKLSLEDRRERGAARQRRYVERQQTSAASANVSKRQNDANDDTQTQTQTHTQTKKEPEIVTSPSARDGVGVYSSQFLTFWMSYPRKVGKGDAWKAWKRLKPELPAVLRAIANQRVSDDWRKDNGAFIPHPATWLNGSRWEDEPASTASRPMRPSGPPVAIAEQMALRAKELEKAVHIANQEAAERFRQQREVDHG